MYKRLTEAKLDDTRSVFKVIIEDDPTPINTKEAWDRQFALLQQIIDTPAIVACGPVRFQKMSMYHTGDRWIIQAEAITESPKP